MIYDCPFVIVIIKIYLFNIYDLWLSLCNSYYQNLFI